MGERLGVTVLHKPKNYFTNESAVSIYRPLCIAKRRHLTQREMLALRQYGVIKVAQKCGGWHEFRALCGLDLPPVRAKYGVYTLTTIVRHYKQLCIEHKRFLTRKELYTMGCQALANAIRRKKGMYVIRKRTKLKYPHRLLPPGHHDPAVLTRQYKIICKKKGYFLTKRAFTRIVGVKAIGFIDRNIGMKKLRADTGLDLKVKKKRKKKTYSKNKAISEYTRLCKQHNGFLSHKELVSRGKHGLAGFIRVHIRYKIIRKRTGLRFPSQKSLVYLQMVDHYRSLCAKHRRFLSANDLIQKGQGALAGSIERLGGYRKIRKATKLDLPMLRFHHPLSAVVAAYAKECAKKRYFLTARDLHDLGYAKLSYAIAYHDAISDRRIQADVAQKRLILLQK